MGTETKVSDGFSGSSGTSNNQGVLTLGGSEGQLVQSDSFTTSLDNSSLGTSSESEGSNGSLGDGQQSVVVSDSTNNDDGLVGGTFLRKSLGDLGDRHGGSVDLGQEQRSENNLVEGSVSSSYIVSIGVSAQ